MIESWHVREALRPRLGSALVDDPGFADGAAAILQSYAPYKDTFHSLSSRLEDYLFNALYDRLGQGMSVRMDNGILRRVRTAELRDAADDLLGVLFMSLKPYSVNYEALYAYFMETGSFSAMQALYLNYASMMSAEERDRLSRTIRESFPRSRWEKWLSDDLSAYT